LFHRSPPFYSYLHSDLWVADSDCVSGCSGVATFNPSTSSTFANSSTPFQITYGSGQASGTLGTDVVQMAGFSVSNQVFAICDQVSSGLLSSPVSGLMGLAFQTIAASKATPFWQTLVSQGAWDEPLMAFFLTRYVCQTGFRNSGFDDLCSGLPMTVRRKPWNLEVPSAWVRLSPAQVYDAKFVHRIYKLESLFW
jgi:hypothetical protein